MPSDSKPLPELLYFHNAAQWRAWLHEHHATSKGVRLVFYRIDSEHPSMRWEEAVKEAICYGWIDSAVKKLDDERRQQLFTPRKPKGVWSKLNKSYITALTAAGLMQPSGLKAIEIAKQNGSWEALDGVENLEIPHDLAAAFEANPLAKAHYEGFSPSYRKNYLYWLNQTKQASTRHTRIAEIVRLCALNQKNR